ncbi:hypothetical protein EDD22DRAFT_1053457 [Suillus occidentalis]|nr:hypothetical protein EDD22DRAFT_1053457 [Suillus occidentalis]
MNIKALLPVDRLTTLQMAEKTLPPEPPRMVVLKSWTRIQQNNFQIDSLAVYRNLRPQNIDLDYFKHPRTAFNNLLQGKYGPSANDHVRWEVFSQGPPNALIWHATIYIDDMNYGYATSRTRAGAQDQAAAMATSSLDRETGQTGQMRQMGQTGQMGQTDVSG